MLAKTPLMRLFALCILLFGMLGMSTASLAMSETERQARLEELKDTIAQLKTELEKVKSNRDGLLTDLEQTESKIGELSEKVKSLKQQLENKQSQLIQLKSEKEALARVKKQQLGSVKQHIQAAYKLGRQNTLTLLLKQQDPSELSRNLHYYDRILSAQAEKIQTYAATIERLDQLEPQITSAAQQLQNHHSQLDNQRTSLLERFNQRQKTLDKIDALLATKDAQLAAMEKDRKHLETLIQRVVTITGNLNVAVSNRPFKDLKGKLPWPTQGKVINNFGSQRVKGRVNWEGMVIQADAGTPVYSIHHGRVVFSDYLRGQGLLIIVDHGDGYMSLYAHNQVLYKELGDWVSAGEQIAAAGVSGGQQSARLYFELRHQGKPTNPKPWLKKAA